MWQDIKNIYHFGKALGANVLNGFPAKSLTVIGVTGTDGKTTTANLIYSILKEAGLKAALISTVSAKIGDKEYDTGFHVSTPDSLALQSYLKRAKNDGVTHLVLEVTSHSLDQHRVFGIPFAVGVLTNISREHLDYHKTMERYMLAKARLLKNSRIVVLNKDDDSFSFYSGLLKKKKILTYSLSDKNSYTPSSINVHPDLPGDFNTYNMLAAYSATKALGIEDKIITKALEKATLPEGRYDVVYDKDIKIIVDFAHTPRSIEQVLKTVKESTKGRVIHVFGSAGQRDMGKRPLMGKASATYADIIILTSEDPRGEKIEEINKMIRKGMSGKEKVFEISDRGEAILKAVTEAKKGDCVIITGKGHEKSMNFGNGEEPWSDHDAVKKALQEMKNE